MKNNLPMMLQKGLTDSGKREITEVADGFFTIDKSKLEKVDAIYVYNSRNKIHDVICSVDEAEKIRGHLDWFFSKGGFNVLYLEPSNSPIFSNVLVRIRCSEDLDYYFDLVKTELEEGRYPVKYSISRVLNLEKSTKWRSFS
jgi:hypothetical protein